MDDFFNILVCFYGCIICSVVFLIVYILEYNSESVSSTSTIVVNSNPNIGREMEAPLLTQELNTVGSVYINYPKAYLYE